MTLKFWFSSSSTLQVLELEACTTMPSSCCSVDQTQDFVPARQACSSIVLHPQSTSFSEHKARCELGSSYSNLESNICIHFLTPRK